MVKNMASQKMSPTSNIRTVYARRILAVLVVLMATAMSWTWLNQNGSDNANNFSAASIADTLIANGQYSRAVDTLSAAYRLDPTPHTRVKLLIALFGSGDYSRVLGIIDDLPADEISRDLCILRAETLLRQQRYEEARSVVLPVLSVHGDDEEAAFILSRSAYALGREDEAKDWVRRSHSPWRTLNG